MSISYDVKISYEAKNVDRDYPFAHEINKGNELWKANKLKGALLCYDSVIDKLTSMRDFYYSQERYAFFYVATNKIRLLERLYEENGIVDDSDEYTELLNLYDKYYEIMQKADRYSKTPNYFINHRFMYDKGLLCDTIHKKEERDKSMKLSLQNIEMVIKENPARETHYFSKAYVQYFLGYYTDCLDSLSMFLDLTTDEAGIKRANDLIQRVEKLKAKYGDKEKN